MEDASNKTKVTRRPAKMICRNCAKWTKDERRHYLGTCGDCVTSEGFSCHEWQAKKTKPEGKPPYCAGTRCGTCPNAETCRVYLGEEAEGGAR